MQKKDHALNNDFINNDNINKKDLFNSNYVI